MANKYIDAEKLIAEIERFSAVEYGGYTFGDDVANGALDYVLKKIIPSLQQEQEKESLGSLIAEAQKVAKHLIGMHSLYESLPEDIKYKYTEGEWRKILKAIASYKQQEQPEVLNEVIGDERWEDTASCEKKADMLESLYNDLEKLK